MGTYYRNRHGPVVRAPCLSGYAHVETQDPREDVEGEENQDGQG